MTYTKEEQLACIAKMELASSAFYYAAMRTGNHAFIEFTGLMNEYIKICRRAVEEGIDFMMANTHSGMVLPIETHHVAYLAEKLDCIYGPSLVDNDNRQTFIKALLGK